MTTDSQQPVAATAKPRRARRDTVGTGLTGRGAVLLLTVVALGAAAADASVTGGLSLIFAATFVAACLVTAVFIRSSQLAVAVIAPPWLYVVATVVAGQVGTSPASIKRLVLEAGILFATNAPTLYVGTGLAGVVTLLRHLNDRRPR